MKRPLQPLLIAVLGLLGSGLAVQAADHGIATRVPVTTRGQLVGAAVSDDHDDDSSRIHWKTGTIVRWDGASRTFVLRDNTGKNRGQETTFTWNDKTMMEGMEKKVGQRAKVKYTDKGNVNMARHVFIGRRAINQNKEDKAAERALPPG